jgi:hypothetical protein
MPVATFGMLDLSIVTDEIRHLLERCITASPLFDTNGGPVVKFDIFVHGDPPDVVRNEAHCNLSLYLFHISQDRYQMNALNTNPGAPNGFPRSQRIPLQPMSLDLYYLLTAYSDTGYVEQQQAMSIALRCLHENPIITTTVPLGPGRPEEFCLTLEPQSVDEAGRLWQATTAPIRLSAVYKVSVIFISPEAPPAGAPKVQRVQILEGSQSGAFVPTGIQLTGTQSTIAYLSPTGAPLSFDLSPAVVAAGKQLVLFGNGLTGASVFIAQPGGAATDVSAWIQPVTRADRKLALALPAGLGAPPGATPPPGIYELTAAVGAAGSNATPISIAPRVDNVANPPVLKAAAGVFTVQGLGFAGASVYLDTVALTSTGGAPGQGQFQVNPAGTQILFRAPASLSPGLYAVRVRAGGVEAGPSWWAQV